MGGLFEAAVDATAESVCDALTAATTTVGRDDNTADDRIPAGTDLLPGFAETIGVELTVSGLMTPANPSVRTRRLRSMRQIPTLQLWYYLHDADTCRFTERQALGGRHLMSTLLLKHVDLLVRWRRIGGGFRTAACSFASNAIDEVGRYRFVYWQARHHSSAPRRAHRRRPGHPRIHHLYPDVAPAASQQDSARSMAQDADPIWAP